MCINSTQNICYIFVYTHVTQNIQNCDGFQSLVVYSHIPKDERQKLDAKARKCIFLGYSSSRKGYRLYDQSSHRVIHSHDVKFNELVCGVEKESSADTPAEKPRVVEESCSSIDDSSSEEVEEQRVNTVHYKEFQRFKENSLNFNYHTR